MRKERGEMTADTIDIQRIERNYYEKLYAKKSENLGQKDTFLQTYNPPKLSKEEAENLKRLITAGELKQLSKNFQHTKTLGQTASQGNFTKNLGTS